MLVSAVWPVSENETRAQIEGVLNLLEDFSTERVDLLHVSEEVTPEAQTTGMPESLRDELRERRLHADVHHRTGHVASAVVAFAGERNADFIVLPWKRKGMVTRALLGDTVRDVVRLADRPVAVDVARRAAHAEKRIRTILYATALTATDRVARPYLRAEGVKADTLYLLHVGSRAPDPEAERRRREEVEAALRRLADDCAGCYTRVETMADIGSPVKRIHRQARLHNVDLIIAGKYDNPGPLFSMMGSVVERLPHRPPCSLLILQPEWVPIGRTARETARCADVG